MKTTESRPRLRGRLPLGLRLLLGTGSVLLLFLLFGVVTAYEFNRLNQANAALDQEMEDVLAAQELSRASLELLLAIDEGLLVEDEEQFVTAVGVALEHLEQSHQEVRDALPETLRLDMTVASISSIIRPMLVQAETGTWVSIRLNRTGRLLEKVDRMSEAIDEAVAITQANRAEALAQAQATQQTVTRYLIGAFVLAAVVSGYVVYATVGQIRRTVATLSASAGRLAAGEWDQRIEVETHGEMARLARTFNEMADQLQVLYSNLEQRVAQRTLDLEQRSHQLETAAQVARHSAAIRHVRELLETTVRLVSDHFGFYHVGLYLVDEVGRHAVLQSASSEVGRRMVARGHKLRLDRAGIVGHVVNQGQPRLAHDAGEDAVSVSDADLRETRSQMVLPLEVRGRIIGVLDIHSRESRAFSDEDVAILRTMADQIALSIENARLLRETQDRLREISFLLGEHSREGWRRLAAARTQWAYTYDGVEVVSGEGAPAEAKAPGRMVVSLQVRGESIGHFDLNLGDRPPTEEEVALAQSMAEQVSLALEDARLFRESQRRAEREKLVGQVTTRMRETLDVETILQAAAQEMRQVLGLARMTVQLVGDLEEPTRE